MYCEQCGAKNEPDSTFCSACGAPLSAEKPDKGAVVPGKPSAGAWTAAVQSRHGNKKFKIAAAAVAVVVIFFALSSLFGGRSDTETAEQFFDAVLDADAEAIVDLVPKGLVNAVMEQGGYTKEEIAEEFESLAGSLESTVGSLDFLGDAVKISYDAVGSEDVGTSQLSYLKDQYDEFNVDVAAAREVTVELRVQADSLGIDETAPLDIPVVKVGSSWYIDAMSLA